MKRVSPAEVPENAVLLDVRDELEAAGQPLSAIAAGREVVKLPLADLEEGATPTLPGGRPVVVVCGNGSRGEVAGALLEAAGVDRVAALEGGVRAWRRSITEPEEAT